MAEQLHDHPWVHVLAEQERRGGVPAVVQADVADAGRDHGDLLTAGEHDRRTSHPSLLAVPRLPDA